jgi:hypothetical protein
MCSGTALFLSKAFQVSIDWTLRIFGQKAFGSGGLLFAPASLEVLYDCFCDIKACACWARQSDAYYTDEKTPGNNLGDLKEYN